MMRWTPSKKKYIVQVWMDGHLEFVRIILLRFRVSGDEFRQWVSSYGCNVWRCQ